MPKIINNIKKSDKRATAFLALIIVLAVIAVGTTLAYVIARTTSIRNEFTPPVVDVTIDINNNTVKNTGDIDVYARVAIVATWVDSEGNILSVSPKIEIAPNTDWIIGSDGFLYYIKPIAPSAELSPIKSVALADGETVPSGYTLRAEVFASVIQATPADAVSSVWSAVEGVDGSGNLTITQATN